MRYSAQAVGDVAAVTSPPYDVMDRRMIDAMLAQHACNIVRLILPRMVSDPVTCENPYERAAQRLARWRQRGVLITDDLPGLYVYEYGDDHHSVCGLVGTVELRTADQRVILPHEDVIDGIVADRLALMTATQANLEPILLVYDGQGELDQVVDRAREGPALTDVRASDGTYHRLWVITDRDDLSAVDRALVNRQALIADGHHRYATYLQLQDLSRTDSPSTSGPADSGLALLIDESRWPVQLGAIHRSVSELSLSSLWAPMTYDLTELVDLLGALPSTPSRKGEMVLTDGRSQRIVRRRGGATDTGSDARRLQDELLPAWGVSDDRVGYHHTVEQALRTARQDGGLAVLLHPATVAEVMGVARAGAMMPRKSTSFGPKPRMGVVMRSFSDEP